MRKFFLQPLTFNISCIRGSGKKETFLLIFPLSIRRMLIFFFFIYVPCLQVADQENHIVEIFPFD